MPTRSSLRRRPAARRAVAALLAATVLTAGAAACSPGESAADRAGRSSGPGTGPGDRTPASPPGATESAGPPAPAMPGPLLLNLHTTGGLAGVDRQTLLYEDGTYTVSREGGPSVTGRLPPAGADRIGRLLAKARLGELPRRTTGPGGADLFSHRISYGGHTVIRDDSTLGGPLKQALRLLGEATGRDAGSPSGSAS